MGNAILTIVAMVCGWLWLSSPFGSSWVPSWDARVAADPAPLRDLVPATALLAVELRDLDRRWGEIRGIGAVARFQDQLFSCAAKEPGIVPGLAGSEAVVFLARSEVPPLVVPVAILRPLDMPGAERLVSSIGGLSCRHSRGALWVAPAGAEATLRHAADDRGARLSDVLPLQEAESRLPPGGLVRGWVNPGPCRELLHEPRLDRLPAPLRLAAAALGAELTAVRYAAFRRDFEDGELIADGIVVYEPSRLPVEVSRTLDPDALSAISPAEIPSSALAVVSFRPEGRAWVPWLRYLAANDPRGPLRNLAFWLDEFQERYRRDLDRDLFGAFGDHAWLLGLDAEGAGPVSFVAVLELREQPAVEATLRDLLSWMGEQVWLGTFGTIIPRVDADAQPGQGAHGITLRTPFSRVAGPQFQIAAGHLVLGENPEALRAGLSFVDALRHSQSYAGGTECCVPVHGSVWIRSGAFARLLGVSAGGDETDRVACLRHALAAAAADLLSIRADMRYEPDAIRLHGRLRFAAVTR